MSFIGKHEIPGDKKSPVIIKNTPKKSDRSPVDIRKVDNDNIAVKVMRNYDGFSESLKFMYEFIYELKNISIGDSACSTPGPKFAYMDFYIDDERKTMDISASLAMSKKESTVSNINANIATITKGSVNKLLINMFGLDEKNISDGISKYYKDIMKLLYNTIAGNNCDKDEDWTEVKPFSSIDDAYKKGMLLTDMKTGNSMGDRDGKNLINIDVGNDFMIPVHIFLDNQLLFWDENKYIKEDDNDIYHKSDIYSKFCEKLTGEEMLFVLYALSLILYFLPILVRNQHNLLHQKDIVDIMNKVLFEVEFTSKKIPVSYFVLNIINNNYKKLGKYYDFLIKNRVLWYGLDPFYRVPKDDDVLLSLLSAIYSFKHDYDKGRLLGAALSNKVRSNMNKDEIKKYNDIVNNSGNFSYNYKMEHEKSINIKHFTKITPKQSKVLNMIGNEIIKILGTNINIITNIDTRDWKGEYTTLNYNSDQFTFYLFYTTYGGNLEYRAAYQHEKFHDLDFPGDNYLGEGSFGQVFQLINKNNRFKSYFTNTVYDTYDEYLKDIIENQLKPKTEAEQRKAEEAQRKAEEAQRRKAEEAEEALSTRLRNARRPLPWSPRAVVIPKNVKKIADPNRKSPPYHAKDFKDLILKGNDGNDWISLKNKRGVYKWLRYNHEYTLAEQNKQGKQIVCDGDRCRRVEVPVEERRGDPLPLKCKGLRRTKDPKCEDQPNCEWKVGKGCQDKQYQYGYMDGLKDALEMIKNSN